MSEIDALEKAAKAGYDRMVDRTVHVDFQADLPEEPPDKWDELHEEEREGYRAFAHGVLAVGKAEMLAGLRERILPLLGQAIGYGEAHPVYSDRAYHNGRVSAFEEVLVWLTEEAKRDASVSD